MITAIDSCILLDILVDDPEFAERSMANLQQARKEGSLLVCDLVVAEIFPIIGKNLEDFLSDLSLEYSAPSFEAAQTAGAAFERYLKRGGKRGRIVADFIIGSHATHQANRLLTRDDGFSRDYFKTLKVWYP